MTDTMPTDAARAFDKHDAFAETDTGYAVETTVFEGVVSAAEAEAEWALSYTVSVSVPTLSGTVEGEVGPAVEEGWLDTLERRLEDAPKATRASVDLDEFTVAADGETVHITYAFTLGSPEQAADVAKTFVEYVEGTYVEGVVPGYDYQPPVADLLDSSQSGGAEGDRGGTPL
jgi:hypothetical protein